MIFTNPRQYNHPQQSTNNRPIVAQRLILRPPVANATPSIPRVVTPANVEPPKPKVMKWGEPTWYFFHTLAEKVKEEHFAEIRIELLNMINMICNNLPCPVCTEHAKQYMNGVNFNTIKTKTDLKWMLFHFHNEVNKRKGYPQYNQLLLDEKYSQAITTNIIHNFISVYENRTRGFKLLADELQRTRVIQILKTWLVANITKFAN